MNNFFFGPASKEEKIVFGAQRPGYPLQFVPMKEIIEWINFMKGKNIARICCLLSEIQLNYYQTDILNVYIEYFGKENICWVPIEDFHICNRNTLNSLILPFIIESDKKGKKVVVHCSGGYGRTGYVLSACLRFMRRYSIESALNEVKSSGRNPLETVENGHTTLEELYSILE